MIFTLRNVASPGNGSAFYGLPTKSLSMISAMNTASTAGSSEWPSHQGKGRCSFEPREACQARQGRPPDRPVQILQRYSFSATQGLQLADPRHPNSINLIILDCLEYLELNMEAFRAASVRCLACKRPIPKNELVGKEGREPGLCESCKKEDGRLASVYLSNLSEYNAAAHRQHAALSTCLRCHSGNLMGTLVCENGECAVLFSKLSAGHRLSSVQHNLKRLDW